MPTSFAVSASFPLEPTRAARAPTSCCWVGLATRSASATSGACRAAPPLRSESGGTASTIPGQRLQQAFRLPLSPVRGPAVRSAGPGVRQAADGDPGARRVRGCEPRAAGAASCSTTNNRLITCAPSRTRQGADSPLRLCQCDLYVDCTNALPRLRRAIARQDRGDPVYPVDRVRNRRRRVYRALRGDDSSAWSESRHEATNISDSPPRQLASRGMAGDGFRRSSTHSYDRHRPDSGLPR